MPRFMLDTDTCSYIIRRSNEAVLNRLRALPIDAVCISVISRAELLYGVEISPRRTVDEAAVAAFLRHVDSLAFTDEAAAQYAGIRAGLRRRGMMIGANDMLIAAHARAENLTLVTNNTREFERVEGLALENWTA